MKAQGKGRRWAMVRRWAVRVGLLGVVLLAGLWVFRHAIANALIDEALVKAESLMKKVDIELVDLESGPVEIPSPMLARVANLRTDFDVGVTNRDKLRSRIEVGLMEVHVAGVFPPQARLVVDDFSLQFHPDDVPPDFPFDRFHDGRFMSSKIPVLDPQHAMRRSLDRLATLFTENEVAADFEFSGRVSINTGPNGVADARLYTERLDDGKNRLRFDLDDLKAVATQAKVRISNDMLAILSEYPLRVPVIMVVTSQAKHESEARKAADPQFPEDAWRHVTWSYDLTSEFGPEFAKRITDAHETLDGNTPDERAMDYHNNAVARALVERGVPRDQLERIILSDGRVIRSPSEVAGREGLMR